MAEHAKHPLRLDRSHVHTRQAWLTCNACGAVQPHHYAGSEERDTRIFYAERGGYDHFGHLLQTGASTTFFLAKRIVHLFGCPCGLERVWGIE